MSYVQFSKSGNLLVFATSTKEQSDRDGVSMVDLESGAVQQIVEGLGNYRNLSINEDGSEIALSRNSRIQVSI